MAVVENARSLRLDPARERGRPRHLIDRLGPIIHPHRVTVRPNLRGVMVVGSVGARDHRAIEAVLPPSHMAVHREVVREAEGIVRVVQQPGPSESGQTVSLIG